MESPGTFHHIWLWEAQALVLTDIRAPEVVHRHAAVQVVVSLSEPTAMRLGDGAWRRCLGTVVAGDVPHAYDTGTQPSMGMWVDPTGTEGRRLVANHLEGGQRMAVLDATVVAELAAAVPPPPDRQLPANAARQVFDAALEVLAGQELHATVVDPRVEAVLHRLEGATHLPPVEDLAAAVGLSTSRLQHLVRREVGMALSRWVLWRRTLRGLTRMLEGATPTEAAHMVGFADAADFTRRFQEFLGASPAAAIADDRAEIVVGSRLDPVRP